MDRRPVKPTRAAKSVSAETTLNRDVVELADMERILLQQCEKVAADLKRKNLNGHTVTVKLKTNRHRILTRSSTVTNSVQMAHQMFAIARILMAPLADGTLYRLIGVGVSHLENDEGNTTASLFEETEKKKDQSERAIDAIRKKFGTGAVVRGRLFTRPDEQKKK